MQYQALYRKYRPQRFDEVIGQDHVTSTLAREVVDDKVAHAYLLTGPRGTGKTTSARLLAKSLNCPNRGPDGEPDNECPSCIAITEGSSIDVIELDAASNNKVEDVREIRINAGTVAAGEGARRVYILDEAHMLTRAAGNALLKILEEPPEHVVFVLATTEPYKLLDTIRSRAQRFDFHPVSTEILIDYLAEISEREGFTTDRAALEAVTSHSGGSVRDAMSLLEQVAALGSGSVTSSGVATALGLADHEVYAELVSIISEGDAARGLTIVAELAARGSDLRRFVGDAIGYFRGIFLTQYAENVEDVVDVSAETIAEWKQQSTKLTSTEVLRAIEELSDTLLHLREGREERLVVEIAVIRLARPETVESVDGLNSRIAKIERELADVRKTGVSAPVAAPPEEAGPPDRPFASSNPVQAAAAEPPEPETARPPLEPVAGLPMQEEESQPETAGEPVKANDQPEPQSTTEKDQEPASPPPAMGAAVSMDDFSKAWPAIMAEIRQTVGPRRQALLREAKPRSMQGSTVVFEVASHMHFHLEQLKADTGIAAAISEASKEHLGAPVGVTFQSADAPEPTPDDDAQDVPDKDDLLSGDGDNAIDPVEVVADILDGQILGE
jgi:DNA polymerase-3 subunit gamma/tau